MGDEMLSSVRRNSQFSRRDSYELQTLNVDRIFCALVLAKFTILPSVAPHDEFAKNYGSDSKFTQNLLHEHATFPHCSNSYSGRLFFQMSLNENLNITSEKGKPVKKFMCYVTQLSIMNFFFTPRAWIPSTRWTKCRVIWKKFRKVCLISIPNIRTSYKRIVPYSFKKAHHTNPTQKNIFLISQIVEVRPLV